MESGGENGYAEACELKNHHLAYDCRVVLSSPPCVLFVVEFTE